MKSLALEISRGGRRMTVMQLLREQIWGSRANRLQRKSDREELAKIYRNLEKKELKVSKQINLIEYEIHKLEEEAQRKRGMAYKINFK